MRDQIARDSIALFAKATEMGQRLEEFEKWLNGLPGRVSVSASGKNGTSLTYQRVGVRWGLVYAEAGCDGKPISGCSLPMKAAAIKLIPELVKKLAEVQEALRSEVEEASHLLAGILETL